MKGDKPPSRLLSLLCRPRRPPVRIRRRRPRRRKPSGCVPSRRARSRSAASVPAASHARVVYSLDSTALPSCRSCYLIRAAAPDLSRSYRTSKSPPTTDLQTNTLNRVPAGHINRLFSFDPASRTWAELTASVGVRTGVRRRRGPWRPVVALWRLDGRPCRRAVRCGAERRARVRPY
jgi:hypothetical protein